MAYLFQKVSKRNITKADRLPNSQETRDWLRNLAYRTRDASFKEIHGKNPEPFKRLQGLSENSIGKMYSFQYQAKHADKLPYWDMFPLIFPIEYYNDSMLGINMHYLPPVLRASLMDSLYDTINNDKFDKTTRLQISYSILKGTAAHAAFAPCIKKYLFSYVRSPFVYISPDEWDIALMLPTQRFQKATDRRVWNDSRAKI